LNQNDILLYYLAMFVSTHVVMGALIGQNVTTPELALPMGIASHFMLDMVPHGDAKLWNEYKSGNSLAKSIIYTAIDSIAAVVIFIYLMETAPYASRATMITGVIGAILPDFLVAVGEGVRSRSFFWFQRQHMRIHNAFASRLGDLSFRAGIFMQLIVLFAGLLVVKR
jgi:hypothetical protein